MSTFKENSIINRVNNNDTSVRLDEHFINVFNKSLEIAEQTGGLFDPTVMPLVMRWKFNEEDTTGFSVPDSSEIETLLEFTGYKKIHIKGNRLLKDDIRVKLDFSGIAQGYTVDVLASFLEIKHITDYMIEVGGEVKAHGRNENGEYWRIGIDDPQSTYDNRKVFTVIELKNKSLATSGIYRKYREINGKRYSHIINPLTGYGVYHNLLSASVIADDCATADALATALIVMGEEGAKDFFINHKNTDGLLIYFSEGNRITTFASDSVKQWIVNKIPSSKFQIQNSK